MNDETFTMNNYGKESAFASFLPGIAGVKGIPIWCYYVNRGQCVVSFGVNNKDQAIMEFYPAHVAYQNVKTTGFRTFIKMDGVVTEPFSDENIPHSMKISQNGLVITESNKENLIDTEVTYYTLPGENLGALIRKVVITNKSSCIHDVEVIDGMPALIPYGVGMDSMKNMTQTTKAWMQVEDIKNNTPYYRVRVSMNDSAEVARIDGGNFSAAFDGTGKRLQPIVDTAVIFGYDLSLRRPVAFYENSLEELLQAEQNISNQLPCSFYGRRKCINSGESIVLYEIIGQVENKDILNDYLKSIQSVDYFENKKQEADQLTQELCDVINTHTASKEFDAYCRYTYMDNVLRGGVPMKLGNNKIFYLYSRKHGDLERDYNYFSMLPEFYSQGNGNFRDVNQNRRCDTFFSPFVERENIHEFYSLIQLDGYNPLGIEKLTYCLNSDTAAKLLADMEDNSRAKIINVVTKAYTPGSLYRAMQELSGNNVDEELFLKIIDMSDSLVNGNFGEGYWSDHWTYNLDLIKDYLEVYPDKEEDMLYEKAYTFFKGEVNINPRRKRYAKTANGIRQYHALNESSRRHSADKLIAADYGRGETYRTTLMDKLILLCTTKYAALDAYGMGVEMEGGKPGWYDALNGMPGMLGSSMAETYELCRMLDYTIKALEKYPASISILTELYSFIDTLDRITLEEHDSINSQQEVISFWNKVNDAKEAYRDRVYTGIEGKETKVAADKLAAILKHFKAVVDRGIEKAKEYGKGICPTYFTYNVVSYIENEEGILPTKMEVQMIPYFLEGPVRYLKLDAPATEKKQLYRNVRNSDLFDTKLSMYKVNASLENASYELGRARAFTPGWLENESIWLHMEYKYLLELLKSGLYEEFFMDFKNQAVPFLDPKVYGRSILENSSFIASSKNPDKKIHGKGFVARLSGSTIEFISMWKYMMFGKNVLSMANDELVFAPAPAIPAYLIPSDGKVCTKLFGSIAVTYCFDKVKDYYPGNYKITEMEVTYKNGSVITAVDGCLKGKAAKDIRDGKVNSIIINIKETV